MCQGPPPQMPFAQPPVCTEQTQGGRGAMGVTSAQSFVPHCGEVGAVQWAAYPIPKHASGWIRVDIAKDRSGEPGRVLARSWVRVEPDCAVPFGGYMTFPVSPVKTKPNKTYWMTFDEFQDPSFITRTSAIPITNLAVSTQHPYAEGRMIQGTVKGWDAVFRVLPDYSEGQAPIHAATSQALATLPPEPYRSASWRQAQWGWTDKIISALPPAPPYVPPPAHTLEYRKRPEMTSAELPQGCWVPGKFPQAVADAVPAAPGLHGLVLWAGTSPNICENQKSCRIFKKQELEDLWGIRITGYVDEALFAVSRCDLRTEIETRLNTQRQTAINRAVRMVTPAMQSSLEPMAGEWCGRTAPNQLSVPTELRLTFDKENNVMNGHGVMTWARVPGGPMGTEGYVDTVDLYPINSNPSDPSKITFSEVSRYRTGGTWTLDTTIPSITSHQMIPRTFLLTRSCGGYWQK